MMVEEPSEPSSDECNANARVSLVNGMAAWACWYPQMGGYHGKCVVVPGRESGGCFDVYVWHDGSFPIGRSDGNPVRLHHCSASQFVEFGGWVAGLQERG